MGLFDLFENTARTARKRSTIRVNRAYGYSAEKAFEGLQSIQGNKVTRTGYGSDYTVRKYDPWTGEYGTTIYHEIKTGKSKLSKLQKKTKRKKKSRYVVDRY